MAVLDPVYRATVYAADGVTVLTPRSGAPHSEELKIATRSGITGFKPYMLMPRGRHGRLHLLEKTLEVGSLSIELLDKRTGTDNLTRWWTAFMGDDLGRVQQLGLKCLVEESVNGGTDWDDFFTGTVEGLATVGGVVASLELRDNAEGLKSKVFVGRPHSSITYAFLPSLMPCGFVEGQTYGGFSAVRRIPCTVEHYSFPGAASGERLRIISSQFPRTEAERRALTITQALKVADRAESSGISRDLRVAIEITSGPRKGEEGHLGVDLSASGHPLVSGRDGNVIDTRFGEVLVTELEAGDPNHIDMPDHGDTVLMWIQPDMEPSEQIPTYIDDVHPVELFRDMLDGKFGPIEVDGTVKQAFPMEASSFTALIADPSFGTFRGIITKPASLSEWSEKHLCVPYQFGYRLNGSGQVVVFDLRPPTSFAGVATIGNADLDTSEDAPQPSWSDERGSAITELTILYYLDRRLSTEEIGASGAKFPDIPPALIETRDHVLRPIPFGRLGLVGEPFEIDALGFRMTEDTGTLAIFRNRIREVAVLNRLLGLARSYEGVFGSGVAHLTIACRRTANTNDCQIGSLKIVDADKAPDPATNLRGGARAMRCVERREDGPRLLLTLADLGPNSTANGPSIGALVLHTDEERHAADVPVTLNAQGEPARLEVAITATSEGTRPAETSELWVFDQKVEASGTIVVRKLPAGRRAWFRARTEVGAEGPAKIPSGWVFSSGADFVDLDPITALAVATSNLTGTTVDLTITPGDENAWTRIILEQGAEEIEIEILPPGSTFYQLRGLDASTAYTVHVEHIDRLGGTSVRDSAGFSTTGSVPTAPSLRGVRVLMGIEV